MLFHTHTTGEIERERERERVPPASVTVDFSCLSVLTKGLFKRDPARVVIFQQIC